MSRYWGLFAVGAFGLAFFGCIGAGVGLAFLLHAVTGTARAVCDQQVEKLLNSDSLVEITRAGILIERLDCAIRRRLPEQETTHAQ